MLNIQSFVWNQQKTTSIVAAIILFLPDSLALKFFRLLKVISITSKWHRLIKSHLSDLFGNTHFELDFVTEKGVFG